MLVKIFSRFIQTSRSEEYFHDYYTHTHTHTSFVQLSRKKEHTGHFFPAQSFVFPLVSSNSQLQPHS